MVSDRRNKQAAHDGQMIANKEKTVEAVGHPTQGAENYSGHLIGSTDHLKDKQAAHKDRINGDRDWGR